MNPLWLIARLLGWGWSAPSAPAPVADGPDVRLTWDPPAAAAMAWRPAAPTPLTWEPKP